MSHIWSQVNILWSGADWTWSERQFVQEVVEQIGGGGVDISQLYVDNIWPNNLEKKKRLIKLICKVNGETYDKSKEVKDVKIKVSDIKVLVKTVLDIELKVKENYV